MNIQTSPNSSSRRSVQRRKAFVLAQLFMAIVVAASASSSYAQVSVSSITPKSGPVAGGNVIELKGANFWSTSQVWIGGSLAPITKFVNAGDMYVKVPAHGAGGVEVDVFDGSSSVARLNNAYTYTTGSSGGGGASETYTSVSPSSITAGKTAAITVTGTNFPSGARIRVNSVSLATTYTSSSILKATAPALAAGTYPVSVINPNGSFASGSLSITYSSGTSPGATGKALSACGPINASGTYYLANDVNCTNVGFALNADNITFNLNGHTISYGSSSQVVPAISVCDTWYSALPASACGSGHHASPVIYNGKIVQKSGTASFTHAIWIGQGNGLKPGTIKNVNITVQQPGTQAIFGEFPGVGWQILNNVINDNVKNIQLPGQGLLSARSQLQGMAITIYNGANAAGAGNLISGNTINGSPQGGIYDTSQNSEIANNIITLSSVSSNDYGVIVLSDGQKIHHNTIQGRGRGLDLESSKWYVHDNTIHVHEEANNAEYGGCELDGSDGIRIKNYGVSSKGFTLGYNTVTVDATYCQANALRFTDLASDVTGTITNNTFRTVAGAGKDFPLSFEESQSKVTFVANKFQGSSCAHIDWDGANQTVQSGQTWSCSTRVLYDADGALGGGAITSPNLTLQDAISSNPSIFCGNYAASLNRIGSVTRSCH